MRKRNIYYFILGILALGVISFTLFSDTVERTSQGQVNGLYNGNIGIGGAPPTTAPLQINEDSRKTLQTQFRNNFRDQTNLLALNMRNIFTNSIDENTSQALDNNLVRLTEDLGQYYPPAVETQFRSYWRNYASYLLDYSIAVKNNDDPARLRALNNVYQSQSMLVSILAEANPNLPIESLTPLFDRYTGSLVLVVDTFEDNDYQESYTSQLEAAKTVDDLADSISNAIIKQFPERFTQ